MSRAKKNMTVVEALEKTESMCCAAEYCSDDIYKKLDRWGFTSADASKIVGHLHKKKFVDDKRFAISFVRDKYRFSHWGVRKIKLALYRKHLNDSIISEAISNGIDSEEYYSVLISVLRSKSRTLSEGNTYEGRTKLYRFAASRGFEPDLIGKAIRTGNIFNQE